MAATTLILFPLRKRCHTYSVVGFAAVIYALWRPVSTHISSSVDFFGHHIAWLFRPHSRRARQSGSDAAATRDAHRCVHSHLVVGHQLCVRTSWSHHHLTDPTDEASPAHSVSAYLPQLGARLHLSSLALNIVSGAGNAGVYLSGPVLGSFVDARGPKPVLSSAALCLLLGYAGLATMYRGGEDGLYALVGVPGLALCQVATGIGGSAGLSASLKATSQSFPSSQRGAAMAAVLACFGLSAFFYSSIARAHLFAAADPTPAFLFTLAVGCTLSMMVGVLFVRPDPPSASYHLLEAEAGAEDDFAYTTPHLNGASPFPESGFSTPRERRILHDSEEGNDSAYSLHPALEAAAQDEHGALAARSRGRRTRSSSPLLKDRGAEGQNWTQHHAGELDVNGMALLSERDFWTLFCFLGLCSGVGLMCEYHLNHRRELSLIFDAAQQTSTTSERW